jgi:hypothetical protein
LEASFLGARGGLQTIPITPINASEYASFNKVSLVTNSPYTVYFLIANAKARREDTLTTVHANSTFLHRNTLKQQQAQNSTILSSLLWKALAKNM